MIKIEYIISKNGNHRMLSVQGRMFITTYLTEAEAATRLRLELEKARERKWNVKAIVREDEAGGLPPRAKVPARTVRVMGRKVPLE